mmetsp:Transcript_3748/g.4263  ORF Transcript_3748/g.4263 Transcript_3748/m.4263 type:complete len:377 (+) Transcript_3748:65-1195(+)
MKCSLFSMFLLALSTFVFLIKEETTTAFVFPINKSIRWGATYLQRATSGKEDQDHFGRTIPKTTRQNEDSNINKEPTDREAQAETTTIKPASNLEPLVVCGPSGVGKGTVIDCLRKRFPSNIFGFSISHTTRQPRPGEIHGQHYYFTIIGDMQRAIDQDKFIEHALVHGNYYGTSKEIIEVLQGEDKITILDIDMQGVKSVKRSAVAAKFIFIAPPSMIDLENRLRGRGTETEEAIQKRLGNAVKEMEYGQQDGEFDRIFINHDVESTVDEMIEILNEWYPQLNEVGVQLKQQVDSTIIKAGDNILNQQIVMDEQQSFPPLDTMTKEVRRRFDIMSDSDKMLNLPSVRIGHKQLKPVDRTEQQTTSNSNEEGKNET